MKSTWMAAIVAGATALASWSVAAQDRGAKELFFGDSNAALQPSSFRPVVVPDMGNGPPSQPVAPKAAAPAAAPAKTNPGLRVWLTGASDADRDRKLSPQQTFRTGDKFRLSMQANRDGYLYIVNIGTSGATRLMFPRAGQDNRIARFKDFSISSPVVFSQPAGTEQLVLVLAAAPVEQADVALSSGGLMKVSLKPGDGKHAQPAHARQPAAPTQPTQRAQPGADKEADAASLDLALADLRGSKDLKFEDDGMELVAVSRRGDDRPGAFAPVVVNLKLTHR